MAAQPGHLANSLHKVRPTKAQSPRAAYQYFTVTLWRSDAEFRTAIDTEWWRDFRARFGFMGDAPRFTATPAICDIVRDRQGCSRADRLPSRARATRIGVMTFSRERHGETRPGSADESDAPYPASPPRAAVGSGELDPRTDLRGALDIALNWSGFRGRLRNRPASLVRVGSGRSQRPTSLPRTPWPVRGRTRNRAREA
jgi:hypothetical protein